MADDCEAEHRRPRVGQMCCRQGSASNLPQRDFMWEVFMRNKLWATAIAIGFAAAANAASPSMHIDGTVSEVNRAAKSFTTQSSSGTSTYKTTDHTIFRSGSTPTNWDAMKA